MPLVVLYLCSLTKRNGTVHLASQLCRLLERAGHRVIVGARPGSKIFEWTEGAVEARDDLELRSGFAPRSLSRDVRTLRELIREREVDVVHAWQSAETYIGALATLGTRARLVRSRTITKPMRPHLGRTLLRRECRATFVTCSRIERTVLDAGEAPERVHRLVEGVDLARFRPNPGARAFRDELDLAPDAFVVTNIGRLEAVKGQVHFVDALARLPQRVIGVVAGEGTARTAIEERARAAGVEARLRLLGKRSDVERVLAASDAYALTSIGSEGSSRATLEALACGLPVVCSDVGMLPDIVQEGRNGYLVAPGDADALARALSRLESDARLCRELGANARRFAEDERSQERMLRSVLEVYESVAARRPSETR